MLDSGTEEKKPNKQKAQISTVVELLGQILQ